MLSTRIRAILLLVVAPGTSAFLTNRPFDYSEPRPSCVPRGLSEEETKDDTTKEDWQGFNPFDPASTKISSASNNKISLRKTRMQNLMSELLNVADEPGAMSAILESNEDLLLEPLEDDEAVVETDSIYKPGMTRAERYQFYRSTMEERIATARNGNVRVVLQKISDFVLSHE